MSADKPAYDAAGRAAREAMTRLEEKGRARGDFSRAQPNPLFGLGNPARVSRAADMNAAGMSPDEILPSADNDSI